MMLLRRPWLLCCVLLLLEETALAAVGGACDELKVKCFGKAPLCGHSAPSDRIKGLCPAGWTKVNANKGGRQCVGEVCADCGKKCWFGYKLFCSKCLSPSPSPFITETLRTAVGEWCHNSTSATIKYGDISTWNTSEVTDMSGLLGRKNFRGPNYCHSPLTFNGNISAWDVSRVITMESMFAVSKHFNQDIGAWDTSRVTDMGNMFTYASDFNQDIGAWDTSRVTNMYFMFYQAPAFNGNIGAWQTSRVTSMYGMFGGDSAFNQTLCFDMSHVSPRERERMFEGSHGSLGSASYCKRSAQTSRVPLAGPKTLMLLLSDASAHAGTPMTFAAMVPPLKVPTEGPTTEGDTTNGANSAFCGLLAFAGAAIAASWIVVW